jgi:hypothetical protein
VYPRGRQGNVRPYRFSGDVFRNIDVDHGVPFVQNPFHIILLDIGLDC